MVGMPCTACCGVMAQRMNNDAQGERKLFNTPARCIEKRKGKKIGCFTIFGCHRGTPGLSRQSPKVRSVRINNG